VGKIEKKLTRKEGFTIIELLTVMSIIIILISILVPAMRKAKIFAKEVQQKNQFKAIDTGLEMFHNDFEEYPESSIDVGPTATGTKAYCGAMKLAEAMVGQDLLGYHQYSRFREDYTNGPPNNDMLYQRGVSGSQPNAYNMQLREGPYLELGNANAHRLKDVYSTTDISAANFFEEVFVLLDVYSNVENNSPTGRTWIGMPVLYYKANSAGSGHPYFTNNNPAASKAGASMADPSQLYYNYEDNDLLVQMGIPFANSFHVMDSTGQDTRHSDPMGTSDVYFFYHNTYDESVPILMGRPHRPDSFILLSAGYDGEYGTSDDVTNFPQ
jgi:type II secretory pathway pseudopilin PulG